MAVTLLVGAIGAILLGIACLALIIYAVRNPIRSLGGWALFLAGSTTLIGLPFVIMGLLVINRDFNWFRGIVAVVCFGLLLGAVATTGGLYEACRDMTPADGKSRFRSSLPTLLVVAGSIYGGLALTGNLALLTRAKNIFTGSMSAAAGPTPPLDKQPCPKLMGMFHPALQDADVAITEVARDRNKAELDSKNASGNLDALRQIFLHQRTECLPAAPRAQFEVLKADGRDIVLDAAASEGEGLVYSWWLGDRNLAHDITVNSDPLQDTNGTDNLPAGAVIDLKYPAKLTFRYSGAGSYSPSLTIHDVYGRTATYSTQVRV